MSSRRQDAPAAGSVSPVHAAKEGKMKTPSLMRKLLRPLARPKAQETELARSKVHMLGHLQRDAEGALPDLFAVISWGCSATTWVAPTLNSHPDVFCLHNLRLHQACCTPNH